jgi:hypothetical protein
MAHELDVPLCVGGEAGAGGVMIHVGIAVAQRQAEYVIAFGIECELRRCRHTQ